MSRLGQRARSLLEQFTNEELANRLAESEFSESISQSSIQELKKVIKASEVLYEHTLSTIGYLRQRVDTLEADNEGLWNAITTIANSKDGQTIAKHMLEDRKEKSSEA